MYIYERRWSSILKTFEKTNDALTPPIVFLNYSLSLSLSLSFALILSPFLSGPLPLNLSQLFLGKVHNNSTTSICIRCISTSIFVISFTLLYNKRGLPDAVHDERAIDQERVACISTLLRGIIFNPTDLTITNTRIIILVAKFIPTPMLMLADKMMHGDTISFRLRYAHRSRFR